MSISTKYLDFNLTYDWMFTKSIETLLYNENF